MTLDNPDSASTMAATVADNSPSPGTLLREARERARLSLEDMSAHTKLSRATLEALERDDHHTLLEPVYVRGYYRRCAKVLELDESALVAAYNAHARPKPVELLTKVRVSSGEELGASSRLPMVMAVLAALAAIVVSAFLWLAREGSGTQNAQRAEARIAVATPIVTPVPTASALPSPAASVDTLRPVAQDDIGEGNETLQQGTLAVTMSPAAPAATATPAPVATAPLPRVPGQLRLRYVQTSWVRINDANGKSLVNGIREAGQEDLLTGALPLSVFLGNAPGVEVNFEGKLIDLRGMTRENNTARFALPQG